MDISEQQTTLKMKLEVSQMNQVLDLFPSETLKAAAVYVHSLSDF